MSAKSSGAASGHSGRRQVHASGEPKVAASVVELTAHAIRNEIKTGRLAPGQRLIEAELCATVGASRASIREALGRLEADGLVEIEHQKGARVRRLTNQDARNIYQIREALEGTAARLAAENVDHGRYRSRLKALEDKFRAENTDSPATYLAYNGYNEQFHRLIVEMSENSRLVRLVEQMQHAAFLMLIQSISNPQAVKKAHAEHTPIYTAIMEGDPIRAERAMRAHIRRRGEEVVKRLRDFLS